MFEVDDRIKDVPGNIFGTVQSISDRKKEFTVEWDGEDKLHTYPFEYFGKYLLHHNEIEKNNPNLTFKREWKK